MNSSLVGWHNHGIGGEDSQHAVNVATTEHGDFMVCGGVDGLDGCGRVLGLRALRATGSGAKGYSQEQRKHILHSFLLSGYFTSLPMHLNALAWIYHRVYFSANIFCYDFIITFTSRLR
jgi:hypothetical protein